MDPCRMCLRCLPFLSSSDDSPPPSPHPPPPPPFAPSPPSLPSPLEDLPSQITSSDAPLASTQTSFVDPPLPSLPLEQHFDSTSDPSSSSDPSAQSVALEQSFPPLQLPPFSNDFEFPPSLASAPITPALIVESSQTTTLPTVLPISTSESFESAPELEVEKNEDDPQVSVNGSELESYHPEPISDEKIPAEFAEAVEPPEGQDTQRRRHHHRLTQHLHDLGHQLKEKGERLIKEQSNHLKEEGSRHLQGILSNLSN